MFHLLLFISLTGLFALFAFSSARADIYVVTVAAAVLALWTGSGALQAFRRLYGKKRP